MKLYPWPLLLVACTSVPPNHDCTVQDATVPETDATFIDTAHAIDATPDAAPPDILLHYRDPVDPGVEGVKCIDVPGPAQDTWVTGWHVERHSGTHHVGVAIRRVGAPYLTPTKCSLDPAIDEGILLSTQPVLDFTLPGGAAILVPAGASLIIETHELNSAPEPVEASVDFKLHTTAKPERSAYLLALLAGGTNVPPATTKTLTSTCYAPRDLQILALTSHTHAHSTAVTATLNGKAVYSSTTWAEPAAPTFDPPLLVKMGDAMTWSCTVANTTAATLTQCQNRDTCEMCEVLGYAIMPAPWDCRK